MKFLILCTLFMPLQVFAGPQMAEEPLPCGIYDQAAHPFVMKDLDTRNSNPSYSTMTIVTGGNRRMSVAVQNVKIHLPGERYNVSIFMDGKPYAMTSHQDLPIYFEVHVDNVKYRVICVRTESGGLRDNNLRPDELDAAGDLWKEHK